MNWYITKIVFRVHVNGRERPAEFDEQLRLISASSKEEALIKASALGKSEEEIIVNAQYEKLIRWEFVNVSSLYRIHAMLDGAQLCSYTHLADDADAFVSSIHKKALYIQNSDTLDILELV